MIINKEMEKLLNDQINMELYSANAYLTMASYFLSQELNGFGNFFLVQSQEEQQHALKYFNFLHDVEGTFHLESIAETTKDYNSHIHVFETALQNEEEVTKSTHNMIDVALGLKDFATYTFLEWFVKEQVEEEALMRNILGKLKLIGNDRSGLFILDSELGARTLTPVPMKNN